MNRGDSCDDDRGDRPGSGSATRSNAAPRMASSEELLGADPSGMEGKTQGPAQ